MSRGARGTSPLFHEAKRGEDNQGRLVKNNNFFVICLATLGTVVSIPAYASTIPLDMTGLSGYGLVALGDGTIGQNSGPLTGNELLGQDITANFAGGGNGQITGTLYYDNTVHGTNTFNQLQIHPTTSLVSTSVTQAALSAADTLSAAAAGLTATQTFDTTITSATTIAGVSGLNVIDMTGIHNAAITISGPSDAIFVINVSGSVDTNKSMILGASVDASQILWNLKGTSGAVLQTSGGDCAGKTCLYGTFLAANGGNFQFSSLNLASGELINTAGSVQFVSGTKLSATDSFQGYTPVTPTPEPSTWAMLLGGMVTAAGLRKGGILSR